MKRHRARLMQTVMGGLAASLAFGMAAAQDNPIEVTGELTVVAGNVEGDAKADADARLSVTATHVTDNGIELGARGTVRADGDQPNQYFSGGRYSSLLAGGDRGFGSGDGDVFLEGAYIFARGGFGSLHVGRDAGAANRLSVTSPTIFRSIGVNDWRTDLTGLNDVHTINDFSGQSNKLTYMPPAGFLGGVIGQLQLGVSYTPELDACGGDRCAPVDGFADGIDLSVLGADQEWSDVVEAALYYQKGFRVQDDPVTIGVSASYLTADDDSGEWAVEPILPLTGDYKAYAFGLNLGFRNLTVGGSFKSTNSALNEDRDEDYLAFDAGVTYEAGEWNFMLGYGSADSERDASLLLGPTSPEAIFNRFDRETQTALAGVSYVFDHGVTLGAAAQFVDSEKAEAAGGSEDAAAVMFESSIKF